MQVEPPKTVTIYASRKGNSDKLKLRNSLAEDGSEDSDFKTDVGPGDTIQWELDADSGLQSLEEIEKVIEGDDCYVKGAVDLLDGKPKKSEGGLKGKIVEQSPGKGKFEKYKIAFKVPGDDKIFWHDPKIQMNA